MDLAVFQFDALDDGVEVGLLEVLVQEGVVDLAGAVGGVREFVGQFAVVGEHQHAGRGFVQAAHRIDALRALGVRDEIHHGLLRVRIGHRRDVALWLVHHQIDLLFTLEAGAVEADVVVRFHLDAQFRHDLAVDRHQPGLDEIVGLAARADAGVGNETVEAEGVVGGIDFNLGGGLAGAALAAVLQIALRMLETLLGWFLPGSRFAVCERFAVSRFAAAVRFLFTKRFLAAERLLCFEGFLFAGSGGSAGSTAFIGSLFRAVGAACHRCAATIFVLHGIN